MEQTPEKLQEHFEEWKKKKSVKLLKLYQNKAVAEAKGVDTTDLKGKIQKMETEISQKEEKLARALARQYERLYKAGASSDAKKARQARTHELCNLGGLIFKAGLDVLSKEALFGMLIQQAEYLKSNKHIIDKWAIEGKKLFAEQKEDL